MAWSSVGRFKTVGEHALDLTRALLAASGRELRLTPSLQPRVCEVYRAQSPVPCARGEHQAWSEDEFRLEHIRWVPHELVGSGELHDAGDEIVRVEVIGPGFGLRLSSVGRRCLVASASVEPANSPMRHWVAKQERLRRGLVIPPLPLEPPYPEERVSLPAPLAERRSSPSTRSAGAARSVRFTSALAPEPRRPAPCPLCGNERFHRSKHEGNDIYGRAETTWISCGGCGAKSDEEVRSLD